MQQEAKMTSVTNLGILVLILFVHAFAGGIAAFGSMKAGVVYQALELPLFAPPASLFGKVWTALYVMNSIAIWFVWLYRHRLNAEIIVGGYFFQLILQALWSWIFFDMGRADVALVEIVILSALVFWLTCVCWRIHAFAGLLMSIYTLWLGFAVLLNASILILNGARIRI
jgi:translocator protein